MANKLHFIVSLLSRVCRLLCAIEQWTYFDQKWLKIDPYFSSCRMSKEAAGFVRNKTSFHARTIRHHWNLAIVFTAHAARIMNSSVFSFQTFFSIITIGMPLIRTKKEQDARCINAKAADERLQWESNT